jgi:hypothetical protein
MPDPSSTMFSAMARLLCTPSPSSPCIKKSIKRTNYIIKSLPAHVWPQFNNALYNGQAVVHTVSLLSVYKGMCKKGQIIYKKPPSTRLARGQQCSLQWPGVVHTVSLLSVYKENRKKDKSYYKKPPSTRRAPVQQCSLQWPGVVHTVSLLSVYKENRKKDKLYIKSLQHTGMARVLQCSL